MRRLRLLPVDDERGASTRYRVLALLPALRAAGWQPEVRYPLDLGRRGALRAWQRLRDLLRDTRPAADLDLLFLHRKTYPPAFARRLRKVGVPVVYDFDDAVDLPPPGRDPGPAAERRYRENFAGTVAASTLVLCGNAELERRAAHPRARIVPTAVDTERFRPGAAAPPDGPALGWVGHGDNLPYLEALADPLRELARRHPGLKLIVVADRAPRIDGVEVEFRRWRLEDEIACFGGMRVGLMPLDDTPWARAKCAFKAIQYMALGIPAVASPVGTNRELIEDGENGFLADGPERWVETVDRLLADPELERSVAAAARTTVEERYSLRVVAGQVVEALDGLVPAGRLLRGPRS
jgi:glycosyltransferase involved in cell wall biosynthesis